MKFLVIGQSVEDHIYYKNEYKVKPGGIYYTVSALQNIIDEDDKIYLCTSYRKDDKLFSDLYEKICPDYLNYTENIPVVRLNIYDDREREEIYQNITGSLTLTTAGLESFDGVLINMITGYDISLQQIQGIRNNFRGPVYFDVHTFSRGLNEKMERKFRQIPDFDKWLDNIDILQVNSRELFAIADSDDKDEIVNYVLGKGVKYMLETRGREGALCYSRKNSEISVKEMYAAEVKVKNQVGLGDVFGAVFFYSYIKNKSADIALRHAVKASGMAAAYEDFSDFKNLRNYVF